MVLNCPAGYTPKDLVEAGFYEPQYFVNNPEAPRFRCMDESGYEPERRKEQTEQAWNKCKEQWPGLLLVGAIVYATPGWWKVLPLGAYLFMDALSSFGGGPSCFGHVISGNLTRRNS